MKKSLFVEPSLQLEIFAVQDSTLNFLSDYDLGENELDPAAAAYGTQAIG